MPISCSSSSTRAPASRRSTSISRRFIRTTGKPVALLANKAEGRAADSGVLEAYSLGFGEPIPVSAEHGIGMPDVYDAIRDAMPDERPKSEDDEDDAADPAKPIQSPSSVSRMPGNPRWSTGSSARSGC